MLRAGIIGLGKMGISHCSIINSHPVVQIVAVSDTSKLVLSAINKYTTFECFTNYKKMIDKCRIDCLIVAAPTRFHADMVNYALERGIHVFCEKPLCLNLEESQAMVKFAKEKKIVNQVGYHRRFIGTFHETKKLLNKGAIGNVYHYLVEAYGPVILKQKGATWRSDSSEGGGCLYDYASHSINLASYMVGSPNRVSGTVLKEIFSKGVEDAVYATLHYDNGLSGQLSVNWSDESYRKMVNQITILGTRGKIISNELECKVFVCDKDGFEEMENGWNLRYITDLTEPVGFNLRGEEFTAQIDYFVKCIKENSTDNINSFASALETDIVIDLLKKDSN